MPDVSASALRGRIKLNRRAWNQCEFDELYDYVPVKSFSLVKKLKKQCKLRPGWFVNTLKTWVPIVAWLPKYERSFILSDMIAGFTVGIMLVPQGMAYASLAGLDPVYGLYSSFFPSILYMIFGTSRHISLGVFAVISLMIDSVRARMMAEHGSVGGSGLSENVTVNSTAGTEEQLTAIVIVTALTFAVGLIQLLMAVFRLSFFTAYLSDQVIGGFTTGAACHVFASQLNKVIGVSVKKYDGLFDLYYTLKDMIVQLPQTNLATLIVSSITLVFLLIGKEYINPKVRKHSPVPIPFELIAVVIATVASYFLKFEEKYNIGVVSHIPTGYCHVEGRITSVVSQGFPEPKLPRFDLIPQMLGDAVSVAVVTFVVTVSVGKLFAKKHGYVVDPMQELRALGVIQCIVSTLSCHPASGGLTRSVLNSQIGVKTEISALFSGSLLLVVILWLGPLLEPLPMCVLACIIIVALKGMFMQFLDLKTLWPVSKIDFIIWLVSFVATAGWDVTQGLIISVIFALITVIFRLQWPKSVELARLPHSDLYRDITRYKSASLVEGVRIFRFDSPLLFTNIEAFKKRAHKAVASFEQPTSAAQNGQQAMKALVVDGSGFTCIDCMGVGALKEVSLEMKAKRIKVYFAACKAPVRDLFELSGFYDVVPKSRFYPSVHDAIIYALSEALAEEIGESPVSQISYL